MGFEYSGKFLTRRDSEQLNTLAKMGGDQLLAIEASQRKIKQQIEDYQGDNWDDKYGSTGLWRKLSAELNITAEYKGQIDFYLALTAWQPQRNKILLEKIANRPTGHWRNRAKLDLITTAIQQSQPINRERRSELLKQLDNLITDCRRRNEDNKLRTEAINVYCRLLLQSKEKASVRKVMDILTNVEIAIDPNLNLFKANSLRQLGKLDESAQSLCEVANSNSYKYTEAMELLSKFIEKIDYYQAKLDGFPKMVKNCYKLASYCRDHAGEGDNRRIALMLAEISTFVTEKEQRKSFLASELVNSLAKQGDASDISLLRCRARLLTAQGKFAEAVRLWAQIAKIHKNETNGAYQRTWKWWRAKFYELDCFAKMPQTEKQGVLHTIEVLKSSFTDIPLLWAEKMDLLKQKCRSQEK